MSKLMLARLLNLNQRMSNILCFLTLDDLIFSLEIGSVFFLLVSSDKLC